MGTEIKSLPENGPYSFRTHGQIYHSVSPLYPNGANKPGYGQLHIFDSAEATTKQLEDRQNQVCISKVMQRLDETLWQVNPFAESYKRIILYQMKLNTLTNK
jgi:hypothetical protein